jgi:glycosyltransferase involved in cell wall biosynthesis
MMKVTHLSKYDNLGGAARAVFRLNRGLNNSMIRSEMFVDIKLSNDQTVNSHEGLYNKIIARGSGLADRLPLKLYRCQGTVFHPGWFKRRHGTSYIGDSDIVNLHWITDGFLSIGNLGALSGFGKLLVWTFHDMWAFTGGCHYTGDCEKYKTICGACPQLGSTSDKDLSRRVFRKKQRAYSGLDLHIVTPSRWLGNCAKESAVFSRFSVRVIPNGLDTRTFKPLGRDAARDMFNLPKDKKVVLFGAMNATSDQRKGFSFLVEALKRLKAITERPDDYMLLIFGAGGPDHGESVPFETIYTGSLLDDVSLAVLYNCADVFVLPSLQDNLPNTVMESLACGTPVAAFNTGGIPDMIEHKENGYLAEYKNAEDLALGIAWVLENENRWKKLSRAARTKAEREYTLEVQARTYMELYDEITNDRRAV